VLPQAQADAQAAASGADAGAGAPAAAVTDWQVLSALLQSGEVKHEAALAALATPGGPAEGGTVDGAPAAAG
jgi:hypothetical protein